jgi:hypothetical protein
MFNQRYDQEVGMETAGLVLTWIVAVGIIGIGLAYLAKNPRNAAGFGIAVAPAPDARAWWQVKGIRDVVAGLVVIVWVFLDPARLGWLVLLYALVAVGDATIVWRDGRNLKAALGIHGATAAGMVLAACLLLAGR